MDSSTSVQENNGLQAREASVNSAVDPSTMPHVQVTSQGAVAIKSGAAVASLVRRARKGFGLAGTTKKRLVLKLDDDAAAVSASASDTNANSSPKAGPESHGRSDDAVPWWKVEYQQPPPGHLGAHVVPVAQASVFQRNGEVSAPNMFAKRCAKTEESALQRPPLDDSPGGRKRVHPSHETPERAHHRARGGVMSLFASVPSLLVDSSPTQKRKIRHVRESEPRNLLGGEDDSSNNEQKRLHDASVATECRPLFARYPTVVTPSRLVKPLTDIEIASDAPSSAAATVASEAMLQAGSGRSNSDDQDGGVAL